MTRASLKKRERQSSSWNSSAGYYRGQNSKHSNYCLTDYAMAIAESFPKAETKEAGADNV
jgi:hypothetical protein